MAKSQPFYKRRWFARLLLGIGIVGLLLIAFCPIPYYLEQPGTAEDVSQYVTIKNHQDNAKGHFLLTTVAVRQATPLLFVLGHFQQHTEVLSREALMGSGTQDETFDKLQTYYIENSENTAIAQAYALAKQPYDFHFIGVYVLSVLPQSHFSGRLKIGDTIQTIDGQSFKSSAGFQKYVGQQKTGQKIKIGYLRQGTEKTAVGRLIYLKSTKRPGLGITLTDHTKVTTQLPVKIDAGDLGGPSAGLMFTLQVYDQLTGSQLRRGRSIAGTGTIEANGSIGAIGGIDKKVVAASKAGATIFFAPDDQLTKAEKKQLPHYQNNYQIAEKTARSIKSKMKIVPVRHLQDAIEYLQK